MGISGKTPDGLRSSVSAWGRAGGDRGEHGDDRGRAAGVRSPIEVGDCGEGGDRGYTPPVLVHVVLIKGTCRGERLPIGNPTYNPSIGHA